MVNSTPWSPHSPEIDLLQLFKEECLLDSKTTYVIQAGYFESSPDHFSKQSLLRGLSLKKDLEARSAKEVDVFTLHNDIGVNCRETCAPFDERHGHAKLEWPVPIIREKTALNRGLRLLRKELKQSTFRIAMEKAGSDTRVCLRTEEGDLIPLAIQRNDNLIALCPLILASFYEILLKKAGSDAVIVDFCHYDEVQRARLAVSVLKGLYLPPERFPRAVVAVATDNSGNNLTPIFF